MSPSLPSLSPSRSRTVRPRHPRTVSMSIRSMCTAVPGGPGRVAPCSMDAWIIVVIVVVVLLLAAAALIAARRRGAERRATQRRVEARARGAEAERLEEGAQARQEAADLAQAQAQRE